MLNSEEKNRALLDKKNKYSNNMSEKKILNETKNHNPPSFKLNGRSLTCLQSMQLHDTKIPM